MFVNWLFMIDWEAYKKLISQADVKALARSISLVENELEGYESLLISLPASNTPVIGITGPPGAGKSTLTDALIEIILAEYKSVAVLCVDPSSAFNYGALLGDRIRMSRWYNNEDVFIRSLASKGSLGGLHPKIIEITDLVKYAGYDYIIVETVGVGQSEVEIAGLADISIVAIVPEAGDEIQTMKAGLMEIADIFVVNKADRPGADLFVKNLKKMLAPAFSNHTEEVLILKTVADTGEGAPELFAAIKKYIKQGSVSQKKPFLLAERAWQLLQKNRMQLFDKNKMLEEIKADYLKENFNLYQFVMGQLKKSEH